MSDSLWPTRAELEQLSDDDLRREHDHWIGEGHQNPTRADFYATELRHREFARREQTMLRLTKAIAWMTAAVVVLTIANLVVIFRETGSDDSSIACVEGKGPSWLRCSDEQDDDD